MSQLLIQKLCFAWYHVVYKFSIITSFIFLLLIFSGLYAFKCKKAEHLFNLVKENAQHCGEEARNNTSRTSAESVWTHPRSRPPSANGSLPRTNGTIQHHSPISIRSTHSHSSSPHSGSRSPGAHSTPVYQNGEVVALTANGLAPGVQYVNTVDIPENEVGSHLLETNQYLRGLHFLWKGVPNLQIVGVKKNCKAPPISVTKITWPPSTDTSSP